jgi:hypothetical protein
MNGCTLSLQLLALETRHRNTKLDIYHDNGSICRLMVTLCNTIATGSAHTHKLSIPQHSRHQHTEASNVWQNTNNDNKVCTHVYTSHVVRMTTYEHSSIHNDTSYEDAFYKSEMTSSAHAYNTPCDRMATPHKSTNVRSEDIRSSTSGEILTLVILHHACDNILT